MYRFALNFVVAAAILVSATFPTFAWNDTGHKITAYIAWQRMSPMARDKVIKLLTSAPEDSQLAAYYFPYGSRTDDVRKREFFMLASTWPDIVRDRAFDTRYKKYHKSNWHYSDTFWTVKDGRVVLLPMPEDNGKALDKIVEFDKLIRSSAPDAQKAIAIAWLEHLIGDIHQPLHASARVTDTEPKGDQGGNLFLLTPQGTPRDKQENLHWLWDSMVDRNFPNSKNECDAEFLDPIAGKIMKKYPYEKLRSRLAPGDFGTWIKESLAEAQTEVFSPDLKRFEMPSKKYMKKGLEVAEMRLALAGYRMGDLLEQVFGSTAVPK